MWVSYHCNAYASCCAQSPARSLFMVSPFSELSYALTLSWCIRVSSPDGPDYILRLRADYVKERGQVRRLDAIAISPESSKIPVI